MSNLDSREWLLTNGLGSYASGTGSDARTRTYHGWLVAALNPPSDRTLLLSHLEASLTVSGKVQALGTNFWGSGTVEPLGYKLLHSFEIEPVPTWIWSGDDWQLSKQIVMPYGLQDGRGVMDYARTEAAESGRDASHYVHPEEAGSGRGAMHCALTGQRVLIQYRYEGSQEAVLQLRLMIGDRNFHHQQHAETGLQFSQMMAQNRLNLQAIRPGQLGTPWLLQWTQGEYQAEPMWYWDYRLPEETLRGLGDREDLFSPGYLTVHLQPGSSVVIEARLENDAMVLKDEDFSQAVEAEKQRLSQLCNPTSSSTLQQLIRAGDQFIVYRQSIMGPTAIAGYHWFNDWGRDTLIALPGLALTTKRYDLARGLLQTFGSYCRDGLIPNTFPDANTEPAYNSIDAALWWIETLGLYLEATQDWNFLVEQYPIVGQIYKAFSRGTKYNIQVDAADGLLSWDAPNVALTWMDAVINAQPVTPRRGKPVEINALWYSALCWASKWAERLSNMQVEDRDRLLKQAQYYTQQAQQVKASLQKFWNPVVGYLYDIIEPDDRPNAQIRPNAVLALSLHHCGFEEERGQRVMQLAKDTLLTPYGLRSLAPDDAEYVGRYAGNPQHRDSAYHQGTVWSWLIGPFIRAWQRFYPTQPVPFDGQFILEHFHRQACIGSISEIFDGDFPHAPQGAIAQAWSVAELIRHWHEVNLATIRQNKIDTRPITNAETE